MKFHRLANDLLDELESELSDQERYFVVEHMARTIEHAVEIATERRAIDIAIDQIKALTDLPVGHPDSSGFARAQLELLGQLRALRSKLR